MRPIDVFNRVFLLALALVLSVVPLALAAVASGLVPAGTVDSYTGYSAGLEALGGVSGGLPTGTATRVALGVGGALLALIALILALRELSPGGKRATRATLDDTPGKKTSISPSAVRSLAEVAARHSGAIEPKVGLGSKKGRYIVRCAMSTPRREGMAATGAAARDEIHRVLESNDIPVRSVEVELRGTAAESKQPARQAGSSEERAPETETRQTETRQTETVGGKA